MTKPDWSKAPEGTTHYGEQNYDWSAAWYKLHGARIAVMLADGLDNEWDWRDIDEQDESELIPRLIARPVKWRGPEDGLPPVGLVCEVGHGDEWLVCEVIAHFERRAGPRAAFVTCAPDGFVDMLSGATAEQFRPIKTQEQRDLEQLQADINESFETNATLSEFLHAKGYRKP